jgi:septum formation protein
MSAGEDTRITLASQSRARAQLLRNAGVDFEVCSPGVDEDAVKAALREDGRSVSDQAMMLAEAKSLKASLRRPGIVLGADQMMECDGVAFDKPASIDDARRQLLVLRGREHALHTALVASQNGVAVWRTLARPRLRMRSFTDAFLDSYLEQAGSACLTSVGAYQLEGPGAQLFDRIDGDYFSILGLPLLPLLSWLRDRRLLLS